MSENRTQNLESLKKSYNQITQRVAQAAKRANRNPEDILVVAVTKNATIEQVKDLIDIGHLELGENRALQLEQRASEIERYLENKKAKENKDKQKVHWHMIGHLQRNKAKKILPVSTLIHSVDSLRLAEQLHSLASKNNQVVDILLQVNTSAEEQKYGLPLPSAIHMAQQISTMAHLRLRGIMAMAPKSDNPENSRPTFARTKELFKEIKTQKFCDKHFNILSMGMSQDFEIAIEQGANVVRIGTALFANN